MNQIQYLPCKWPLLNNTLLEMQMEEVDAPGNMGNPTANQYGGRASGTKRVRKGR